MFLWKKYISLTLKEERKYAYHDAITKHPSVFQQANSERFPENPHAKRCISSPSNPPAGWGCLEGNGTQYDGEIKAAPPKATFHRKYITGKKELKRSYEGTMVVNKQYLYNRPLLTL